MDINNFKSSDKNYEYAHKYITETANKIIAIAKGIIGKDNDNNNVQTEKNPVSEPDVPESVVVPDTVVPDPVVVSEPVVSESVVTKPNPMDTNVFKNKTFVSDSSDPDSNVPGSKLKRRNSDPNIKLTISIEMIKEILFN